MQSSGLYDSSRRSKSAEDGHVVLPVLDLGQNLEQKLRDAMLLENPVDWKIVQIQLPASKKNQIISPYQQIVSAIDKFLRDHGGAELTEDLRSDIPRRWERHGDLVMIDACFQNPFWGQYGKIVCLLGQLFRTSGLFGSGFRPMELIWMQISKRINIFLSISMSEDYFWGF